MHIDEIDYVLFCPATVTDEFDLQLTKMGTQITKMNEDLTKMIDHRRN